jgi:hypothetical protein
MSETELPRQESEPTEQELVEALKRESEEYKEQTCCDAAKVKLESDDTALRKKPAIVVTKKGVVRLDPKDPATSRLRKGLPPDEASYQTKLRKTRRNFSKREIDFNQAFLAFIRTGSLEEAAKIVGVDPSDLAVRSARDDWAGQLDALSTGAAKGNGERAANRALSFSLANRMRLFCDQIMTEFLGMIARGEKTAIECLRESDGKGGTRFNTRLLGDITKAIIGSDHVTSKALGDTVTERLERKEDDDDNAEAAQLSVLQALASLGTAALPVVPPDEPKQISQENSALKAENPSASNSQSQ